MKFTIEVDCTPTELLDLGRKIMPEDELRQLLGDLLVAGAKTLGPIPDPEKSEAYSAALTRVSWDTIYLLVKVLDLGIQGKRYCEVEFEDLVEENCTPRMISSRIGGLRKATDAFNLIPMATIRRDKNVTVCLEFWSLPIINSYISDRQLEWVEFLEMNDLEDPISW